MRSGMALALCLAVGVSGPAFRAQAPAFEDVTAEPKTIDPRRGERVSVRFRLDRTAEVFVDFVDPDGRRVGRVEAGTLEAGARSVVWDGRTPEGRPVGPGVYRYVIHARDASGRTGIHDPSRETGGDEVAIAKFTYDREFRVFRWSMPKAGWARLRVGLAGFPHLRTLLDWEPLEAGEHQVAWDGLDASGHVALAEHPRLAVALSAYAMPWDTIIVRGDPQADVGSAPAEASSNPFPSIARPDAPFLHARHAPGSCREVRCRLELPAGTVVDDTGRPVVTGIVPVRIVLDERDVARATNSRFEVGLFEDLTSVFEEEEGVTPLTYLWDTSQLPPGEHLLTVNILTYDDHVGVASTRVLVQKADGARAALP